MIAREEVPFLVEQSEMTSGVARCGNDLKVWFDVLGIESLHNTLRTGLSLDFQAMDDASGVKMFGKFGRIGDIIPMSEKNCLQPTQRLEATNQLGQEFGRVNHPIASRTVDEVAAAAVRFGRGKAAVKDIAVNANGKFVHHALRAVCGVSAYGSGRAGYQGQQGGLFLGRCGLQLNECVAVGVAKDARS